MNTTTITISEGTRRNLVRLAAELQAERGRKVGYDDVLRYLIARTSRSENLLRDACKPVAVVADELRRELSKGRSVDRRREQKLEARYA